MLLQKLFFFAVMNPLYAAGLQWATQAVNTKTSSNSATSIYVVKTVHSHSHRLYLKLNKEKKYIVNARVHRKYAMYFTLSETTLWSKNQYDWRKIEQVTIKANFIHFWCVESKFITQFIVKNQFHLDTRVRMHLAHFWKIWLFSSTSALAITSCCKWSEPCWQWCWQLLEYHDFPKIA